MKTLKITGKELNELFAELYDQTIIVDQEHVDYMKEELDYDLSKFIGYEITHEQTGRTPNHDSDDTDYELTIMTPDGKKYSIEYETNLMMGLSFRHDKTYELNEVLSDEEKLNKLGWSVVCESPHELQHEDGSFASGQAANIVVEELTRNFNDYI